MYIFIYIHTISSIVLVLVYDCIITFLSSTSIQTLGLCYSFLVVDDLCAQLHFIYVKYNETLGNSMSSNTDPDYMDTLAALTTWVRQACTRIMLLETVSGTNEAL